MGSNEDDNLESIPAERHNPGVQGEVTVRAK